MLRIALVACAKRKRRHAAPAKALYASPLFQLTRQHVEGSPDYFTWYVVSAQHGLVDPDQTLEPYDLTLAGHPPAERAAWGERVTDEVRALYRHALDHGVDVRIDLFAGALYRRHLAAPLRRAGFRVHVPLAGLRIGQQLAWLARAVERQPARWPGL